MRAATCLAKGTTALLLASAVATTMAAADEPGRAVEWSFEVLEVTELEGGHRLRLKPMPPGRKFPRSCETFTVNARYSLDPESPRAAVPVSAQQHEDALRTLERAAASGRIIRFGAIGRGFAPVAGGSRCEVASEALFQILTSDGRSAVFSVVEAR